MSQRRVLLTGATGYVGGRLLEALEQAGAPVRCLARRPEHLAGRVGSTTEVVAGDCLDAASLDPALRDVETAFYLVHSMGAKGDFAEQDRQAAQNFGDAARRAGVSRIVYLGGLGEPGQGLSPHLRSRQETGDILRASGVPVIELRASIILGSGSLSFEMIRALVERLPVMICPRWVQSKAQPIHIQDVISYLTASLQLPHGTGRVYEIGGTDVVSYEKIMREYARQRGLRRWMIPVPVLTPYLSSLWLGLTTPLYARVGRKLIGSIRNSTVVQDDAASRDFDIRPAGLSESISRAIRNEDRRFAVTRWSDAASSGGAGRSWGGVKFGTRLVDSRSVRVAIPPERAFLPIQRIGGKQGWYFANTLWKLRGFIDLLIGGVGLRRGRRDPEGLTIGDTVDCWRVEAFEPGRLLRLSAEMKVPGRAWLQFEVKAEADSAATIHQIAMFDPVGLMGQLYWYGIYPLHDWVFRGMLRAIAAEAVRTAASSAKGSSGAGPTQRTAA
jgi:uncharacterized protein YbjT (DUF2867 family)